ncbi:MAG: hypothetical protein RLZZ15_288 [Verrucomicrobiota bacterium]|jgi:uncharacterized protein YbaA (DUF1428 family)
MPNYVDGYVLPVSKRKLPAYLAMARKAAPIWREHGALDYNECVLEDAKAPFSLSFPKGIRAKAGETIVLAFVVYKSRAHRDRVNAAVMKDPRLAAMCDPKKIPFDCKRMLFGGFTVAVT